MQYYSVNYAIECKLYFIFSLVLGFETSMPCLFLVFSLDANFTFFWKICMARFQLMLSQSLCRFSVKVSGMTI